MVKKGHFTVELVSAETKAAFQEHARGQATFIEVQLAIPIIIIIIYSSFHFVSFPLLPVHSTAQHSIDLEKEW
jgi:hypothetical protein